MKFFSLVLLFSLTVFTVVASPIEQETKRLIKTNEEDSGKWMTLEEIFELKRHGTSFVDVTDYPKDHQFNQNIPLSIAEIPSAPRFQAIVRELINNINKTRVESFVRDFSAFYNRFYNTPFGEQSQQWLLSQVEGALQGFNGNSSVVDFGHTWRQNSIIARIEGTHPQLKDEVVIIGAHEDSFVFPSINATSRAPGADDNASGCIVVLETLRVLATAGIRPSRTVEFHWYAAEEVGLLGSGDIATNYRRNSVNVVAMLNFDVVGHQVDNVRDIGLYLDNSNYNVTQFLRALTDEYLTFGWQDRNCGFGCSDHFSWAENGYDVAMAAEVELQKVHNDQDTIEKVGFEQVMEFVKLAIAFTVELGEPVNYLT